MGGASPLIQTVTTRVLGPVYDAGMRKKPTTIMQDRDGLKKQGKVPDAAKLDELIALFTAGRYPETEKRARSMTLRYPKHAVAWMLLGAALRQQGRIADALLPMQRSASLLPGDAGAHNNLGVVYLEIGRIEEAEQCFRRALRIRPDYPDAHNNLGNALREQQLPEQAERCYLDALRLRPDYPEAHNNLGVVLREQGLLDESCASYRRALQLSPDYADACSNLAVALLDMNCTEESEQCCRQALRMQPAHAKAHNNLGNALRELGRLDEAEQCYRRALEHAPGYAQSLHGLGNLCLEKGDFERARSLYERILAADPGDIQARYSLSLTGKAGDEANFAALQKLAERRAQLPVADAIYLNFALGRCCDERGDYSGAFGYFGEGCRLKRGTFDYDPGVIEKQFDAVMSAFDSGAMARLSGQGNRSELPVFVLGMPRSGTTLIEQIIASHPEVHGAGELGEMLKIASGGELVENLGSLDGGCLAEWGEKYLAALEKHAPGALRITDKMPGNFIAIGLIHLMLPNARIIHVRRNPFDTCVSCYTQLFTHGNEYSYDLAELAAYYAAYARLMAHWRTVLPEGAMLEVDYEALIDAPEQTARRIIEYCGLRWDDACLDYRSNDRPIQTASVAQVRQPIYRSSLGRWRRYQKFLGPLFGILGDPTV